MVDFKLERALYKLEGRTDHQPRVVYSIWQGTHAACPCGWRFDTHSNSVAASILANLKKTDHEREFSK